MIDIELLSLPLAQRLTSTLAHFVWQGFAVMLICRLFLRLSRRSNAQVRYAALLLGMTAVVLCPVATFRLLSHASADVVLSSESAGNHHHLANYDKEAANSDAYSQLQPLLLGAWLAGVLILSLKLALGACSLQYLRRGSKPVSADLADRFEWLGRRLGVQARRTVYLSHKVQEALVVGFVRPAILLPVSWVSELPTETLEAIVAHELAHIRRWDLWVNLVQRAIETLLFYHPAVWWISRQVRIERELCCDELAVAATGDRIVYATALEQAARQRIAARQPALAAALRGESRMSLLRRVRNVLEVQPRKPRASWLPFVLLLAIGAGVFTLAVTGGLFTDSAAVLAQEEERERDEPRDKDRDRPRTEREGDRESPEGRARREEPRDGDRESPEARRGREPRRDGDRPDARREGDRRPPAARDRDEPRRPTGRDVPRRDGDGREDALIRLLMELRREVAGLRQEVRELRERSDLQMRSQVDRQRREQGGERERQERTRVENQQRERQNIEKRNADGARRGSERERDEAIKRQRAIQEDQRAASRKREEDRRERLEDKPEPESGDDNRESDDQDEEEE